MNHVKSRAFKTAVIVCTSHVLHSYRIFTLSKFFHEFNFRCQLDQQKSFNTELFPIYGTCLKLFSATILTSNLDLKLILKL